MYILIVHDNCEMHSVSWAELSTDVKYGFLERTGLMEIINSIKVAFCIYVSWRLFHFLIDGFSRVLVWYFLFKFHLDSAFNLKDV